MSRSSAFCEAYASRILDLKRDSRFKYVTVFENRGALAGDEWTHPHSQVTATMFVPRRILYELRSARAWYEEKERCVFCDIVRQEEKQGQRIVDTQGDYVAFCPYASRVPFEIWLMPRRHNHLFEQPQPGSQPPPSGRAARPSAAPPDASLAVLSPGPAHRSQHGAAQGRADALLADHRRRFPLAHSKSCPSSRRAASPTASRKSTSTLCCPSKPPNASASSIPIHEAPLHE